MDLRRWFSLWSSWGRWWLRNRGSSRRWSRPHGTCRRSAAKRRNLRPSCRPPTQAIRRVSSAASLLAQGRDPQWHLWIKKVSKTFSFWPLWDFTLVHAGLVEALDQLVGPRLVFSGGRLDGDAQLLLQFVVDDIEAIDGSLVVRDQRLLDEGAARKVVEVVARIHLGIHVLQHTCSYKLINVSILNLPKLKNGFTWLDASWG